MRKERLVSELPGPETMRRVPEPKLLRRSHASTRLRQCQLGPPIMSTMLKINPVIRMFPYYIAAIIYLTNGPLPAYLDGCVFDGWVVVLASTPGDEHEVLPERRIIRVSR